MICLCCARVCLYTAGRRSRIEWKKGGWLLGLPAGSLTKNFPHEEFARRYAQAGSPLAYRGPGQSSADFGDWHLFLHPDVLAEAATRVQSGAAHNPDVLDIGKSALLCCPEDHTCAQGCSAQKLLCRYCDIPVCRDCLLALHGNEISPMGLINDNFIGYLDAWIYQNEITWMEKTVATP